MRETINLLTYYRIIKKRFKYVILFVFIMTSVVALYTLRMQKIYLSEALLVPSNDSTGVSGGMGGAQSLAMMVGVDPTASSTQKFLAILESRNMAEYIVKKYNLKSFLLGGAAQAANKSEAEILEDLSYTLMSKMNFDPTKASGGIRISAESEDPEMAAHLVDYYIDGLQYFLNHFAFSKAKHNRLFIEDQLTKNKIDYLNAGKALADFYKKYGISSASALINVPISVDFNLDESEIESRMKELATQADGLTKKYSGVSVQDVPQQVYLNYLILTRDILSQVSSLLANQYEMAKIQEAKDQNLFQVIDPARVPTRKYKPRRVLIVGAALTASIMLALAFIFFIEYIEQLKQSENN